MPGTAEKKDLPEDEKGDKGHAAERKQESQEHHGNHHTAGTGRHGEPHRRRTGGNPDASNDG